MSQSVTLRGADVKIYANGKLLPFIQSITYTIDYGETSIYGIDSVFPQSIEPTKISVKGTINGIKIKRTSGLQGYTLRPRITEALYNPYISLRVSDRQSNEDILIIQQCKIGSETVTIQSKTTVKINCTFTGIIPLLELDQNY
jgi:hypothetical protein